MGTSGVLEYSTAPAEGEGGGEAPAPPPGLLPGMLPGLLPGKARLPFTPQDVQQGSGALRQGDHVTFRIATNLQARRGRRAGGRAARVWMRAPGWGMLGACSRLELALRLGLPSFGWLSTAGLAR